MQRIQPDSYEIDVALRLTVEDEFSYFEKDFEKDFEQLFAEANCICKKKEKWFDAFGKEFPLLPVNKSLLESGEIRSRSCPLCGRTCGKFILDEYQADTVLY